MNLTRRSLIVSFALAPALPGSWSGTRVRAAETVPAAQKPPLSLVAQDGGPAPQPPLRYGEGSPGPVLRLKRGVEARVVLRNAMASPTSLDLQGLRISPPLGGAGPVGGAVQPGASAEILVVPEDAGTFWYHPWILDPRADQTALGLAGALIVEEPEPPEVDVDIVAMLTDSISPVSAPIRPTETLRIDGHPFPRVETVRPGSRVRLRLINASTRQAVNATVTGTAPVVVAIDGQPSEMFRPRGDTVPLGPGARVDLMVDMPGVPGAEVGLGIRGSGEAPPGAALLLKTMGEPWASRGPLAPLPANPLLPRAIVLEEATRATLTVDRATASKPGAPASWTVNGVAGFDLPKKPLLTVKRGRPVALTFKNASPALVAFRLHGFVMRVLHDLDDGWEPYWREAITVPPGRTHHAAFLADRPGRWLIESPFFDQAAGGLRAWFEVT